MTLTAYLDITDLNNNQNTPEVTVNEGHDILVAAIAGRLVHNMASDADYTLDTTTTPKPFEWQNRTVEITDTGTLLTAARNIIVPAKAKEYVFFNNTAQILTLKTAAGTGIAVAVGKRAILYCDGTNVVRHGADV